MNKINCIIIDDEEIDRLMVMAFLKRFANFNILGVFDSALDALPIIEKQQVDVVFLDIDMPKMNGLEFRKQAINVPVCIYITDHPEHALESFELDTLDFILKPLKLDRFTHTINRIEEFLEIKQKAQLFEATIGGDTIYIKEGHEQTKIKLHDILYLEALKDYTLVVTNQKKHCVLSNIGNLLKEVNFQSFVRIHRSFAVQIQYIKKINTYDVQLNNDCIIPIGKSFRDNLSFML